MPVSPLFSTKLGVYNPNYNSSRGVDAGAVRLVATAPRLPNKLNHHESVVESYMSGLWLCRVVRSASVRPIVVLFRHSWRSQNHNQHVLEPTISIDRRAYRRLAWVGRDGVEMTNTLMDVYAGRTHAAPLGALESPRPSLSVLSSRSASVFLFRAAPGFGAWPRSSSDSRRRLPFTLRIKLMDHRFTRCAAPERRG